MSTSTLTQPTTTTGVVTNDPSEQTLSPRSRRKQLISDIANTAKIDHNAAARFLDWLKCRIDECRSRADAHVYLTSKDIRVHHDTLVAVIPGNQVSTPGSVHSAIERHLLDPARGEVGIMHDMGVDGAPRHCSVGLRTSAVT